MHRPALWASLLLLALGSGAFAQSQTLHVGGAARTYILHVPTGLKANPPLMFVLCGHGMTGADQERDTKMDGIADRDKFIVVYPDAVNMNWDQTGTTDLVFILALLDSISAKYHTDPERVYVAGFSQGAAMVHVLGCDYPDKFAAIAPVSGNIPDGCAPKRPISMFVTFGTKDIFPAKDFFAGAQKWADLNGCPATPKVIHPYPASNPSSVVTRIDWVGCKNGTEVIADSILNGPHEWPMDTKTKVNNSEEVWAFFQKFTLSGTTALPRPTAVGPSFRATYANGVVRLEGMGNPASARILDHQGRLVAEAAAGRDEIDFRGRPAGVYRVLVGGKGPTRAVQLVIP
jgi:polyhydroxybutyrate depolymerase